jgi:hypothetical protein
MSSNVSWDVGGTALAVVTWLRRDGDRRFWSILEGVVCPRCYCAVMDDFGTLVVVP